MSAMLFVGTDDHELARLERSIDRSDFDEAVGGQSRLDDDVFERAIVFDLDSRRPIGGER